MTPRFTPFQHTADMLSRAVRDRALTEDQRRRLIEVYSEAGVIDIDDTDDDGVRLAALRFHVWMTSAGPLQ